MDLNRSGSSIARKLHTCRANPALWVKRIDEVAAGKAVLVLYEWNGKPYSKDGCKNLFIFGTSAVRDFIYELLKNEKYAAAIPVIDSGVGVQGLVLDLDRDGEWSWKFFTIGSRSGDVKAVAKNDGLSAEDFKAWFKGYDLSKPMAIIHLTKFRY